jgi:hypothetical protein
LNKIALLALAAGLSMPRVVEAGDVSVTNCLNADVALEAATYNADDLVKLAPHDRVTLGRGFQRTLRCATPTCSLHIRIPSKVPPEALSGNMRGLFLPTGPTSLIDYPTPRPHNVYVCLNHRYDADGQLTPGGMVAKSSRCSCR